MSTERLDGATASLGGAPNSDHDVDAILAKHLRTDDIEPGSVAEVNCNDWFYWACSDSEPVFEPDMPRLRELTAKYGARGPDVWVCEKRGMRPQHGWLKRWKDIPDEILALPHRTTWLANPDFDYPDNCGDVDGGTDEPYREPGQFLDNDPAMRATGAEGDPSKNADVPAVSLPVSEDTQP